MGEEMKANGQVMEWGKLVGSPLLAAVLAVGGYNFAQGKQQGVQETQVKQNTAVLVEIKDAVKSLASTINSMANQQQTFQAQLDAMNAKAADRWTGQDQRIFELELKISNPSLDVPDTYAITSKRAKQ